uniref:Peroxisomal membrane protein 11C-like protein n=1 Tax=Callorhinchus milii TaxID=7868 RepID=V9LBD7_CALMI
MGGRVRGGSAPASAVAMEAAAQAMESYRGRDNALRTACYASRLFGGLLVASDGPQRVALGRRLLLLSRELGGCRTVLRLFDSLSVYLQCREYGLGAQEKDSIVRWSSVIINAADQLYYPCEHLAWAADTSIISIQAEGWWTATTLLWGLALATGVVRSFRALLLLRKRLRKSENRGHVQVGDSPTFSRKVYKMEVRAEILNIISNLSDLGNAIHWMPAGFLWSGKFPDWLVGLMGSVSSLIGVYQMSCKKDLRKDL